MILPLVEGRDSRADFDFSDGSGFVHSALVANEIRPVFIKSQERKIVALFMVEPHEQARGTFRYTVTGLPGQCQSHLQLSGLI